MLLGFCNRAPRTGSSRATADGGRGNPIFGPVRNRVLSSTPAGKHRVQFSERLEDVTAAVWQTPD
jgi:hypothetical protein